MTTTNIYHYRDCLGRVVTDLHGKAAGHAVVNAIKSAVTCYAAKLHLNRVASIIKPERPPKKGYAPTFEQLTKFEGRMATAAGWSDLLGTPRPGSPWKDCLPRMIFVSDMGDAMSTKGLFPFLKQEVAHLSTEKGRRHLWLWLTKRPHIMRDFAEEIGGLPSSLTATHHLKKLLLLPMAGIFMALSSCKEDTPAPPAAYVTDTEPVGAGLTVIGFAMVGAAVVIVLGRLLR